MDEKPRYRYLTWLEFSQLVTNSKPLWAKLQNKPSGEESFLTVDQALEDKVGLRGFVGNIKALVVNTNRGETEMANDLHVVGVGYCTPIGRSLQDSIDDWSSNVKDPPLKRGASILGDCVGFRLVLRPEGEDAGKGN